jgi:hypothetical protein
MRSLLALSLFLLNLGAQAGPKVRPVVKSVTVEDQISADYQKSASLMEFVDLLTQKLLPGDAEFIVAKLAAEPELMKLKKLPKLSVEQGAFKFQLGKMEDFVRFLDQDHFEFDINRNRVSLFPGMMASERWARIGEIFERIPGFDKDTVAIAQVLTLLVSSAASHGHAHSLGIKIGYEDTLFPFTDLWHRALETPGTCTSNLLLKISQKMSDLQVSSLRCDRLDEMRKRRSSGVNALVQFQIPLLDAGARYLYVDSIRGEATELAPDLQGAELVYYRSHKPDAEAATGLSVPGKPARVQRAKGMNWETRGTTSDELILRAQQLRELFETAYVANFCGNCLSLVKVAAAAAQETQKFNAETKAQENSTANPVINPFVGPPAIPANPPQPPPMPLPVRKPVAPAMPAKIATPPAAASKPATLPSGFEKLPPELQQYMKEQAGYEPTPAPAPAPAAMPLPAPTVVPGTVPGSGSSTGSVPVQPVANPPTGR